MYYFAIVNWSLFCPFFLSLTTFVFFAGIKHRYPIYVGDLYTPTWPKHVRSIVYRWLSGDAEKMAMEFL